MSKSLCVAVFIVVFVISLLCVSMLAQHTPPSADTFVSSSTPKTNYGSATFLGVGSGANTYLEFDLSGLPAGPSVSKASIS